MNKAILMGRLTRDPEVRYSTGDNQLAIARFTLAVDRRFRRDGRDGEATADFIPCVAFGKQAEFAEKYFRQGIKIAVTGRIQTGSYNNREGQKVYTTEIIVEEQEFAESKGANDSYRSQAGSYGGGNYGDNRGYNNGGSYGDNRSYNNGGQSYGGNSYHNPAPAPAAGTDGFMNIPDGIDEELPFN